MRIAVAALFALVLSTSIAAAQAPGQTMSWDPQEPPSAVVPQTVTVNYRSDILMADGLSLGLIMLGPAVHSGEVSAWGLSGYFLAAPIVHVAHGRGVAGLESFALRAGLPLLGGMIGYRLGPTDTKCVLAESGPGYANFSCNQDPGSVIGAVFGAVAGGVTAIVLDTKYLAKYEKRVAPSWTAGIVPTRGGATFGVSGAF